MSTPALRTEPDGRRPRPRVARHATPRAAAGEVLARWVTEVELTAPLGDLIAPRRLHAAPYELVRVLVRLHRQPVGIVELPLLDGRLPLLRLLEAIDAELDVELFDRVADETPRRLAAAAPLVSVIIATRERPEALAACLRTMSELKYPRFEVLVVDNAPVTDATERVVRAAADPRIRRIVEPRPGASGARNRGAREAAGEILAFTDDDVIADPLWLSGMVRGFARAEGVTCVTGLVPAAELDTEAQLVFDARVGWATSCTPRLFDLHEHRIDDPLYPFIPGALGTGANFGVRRDVFLQHGPFDEALGPGRPTRGGEDLDLFLRLLLAGERVAYEPAALVWHVHRRDAHALRDQLFGYGAGLGAYAFKLLTSRATAVDVLRNLRRGLGRLGAAGDTSGRPMPRRLLAIELAGLAAGPVSYLRARAQERGR